MGLLFGTIFGIMDMEEVSFKYLRDMLIKEENYCIPIGIICGGMMGLFCSMIDNNENEILVKNNKDGFSALKQEDEVEI
jgi:hypothetical protein